jgi:tetratricopeptide (TPR) repeat protein
MDRPNPSGPQKRTAQKQPWERLLTGADAKQVEELEARVSQLEQAGRFAEAAQAAEAILGLRRRVQGGDHWETVDAQWQVKTLHRVATLPAEARVKWASLRKLEQEADQLLQGGHYAKAQPLWQRVLDGTLELLGEDHPETFWGYYNLARNLGRQGEYARAQAFYQKALDLSVRLLGEDHAATAWGYNGLALSLNHQGQHAQAQPMFEKALGLYRRLLGENHFATADGYNNLAMSLNDQGQHARAQPMFEKALAIRRQVQGEDHPDTATSYNNVAVNLYAQGKYAQAQPLLDKALAIRRQALGEDHPDTAGSCDNLAANLRAQGKYAEAQPLFQKALDLKRRLLGEGHPDTATSYDNLAANLHAQGKYAEAQELFQKALDLSRRLLGEGHPDTATSYDNLAANLRAQGKYAEAQPLFQKALDLKRRLLGEGHPATATCYNNLAANLHAQGEHAEAQELFQKALDLSRRLLGEGHPDTAQSYNNLAANLRAQGKYAEAQPLVQRALDLRRRLLGEDHPDTIWSYNNLASNFHARGEYARAEAMWTAAARGFEAARLRISFAGLDRAPFTADHSPLPGLAACLARAGKASDAWQRLETNQARGLLDDLSARLRRPLNAQEVIREQELIGRLRLLDEQTTAVLKTASSWERCQVGAQALCTALSRQAGLAAPQAVLQTTFAMAGRGYAEKRDGLRRQRLTAQAELGGFEKELVGRYGVAAGDVYRLEHIQAQLPPGAALLAWVDRQGSPQAADPNGEHWACLVRSSGAPVWERLRGSGPQGAWTTDDDHLPNLVRQAFVRPGGPKDEWKEPARRLYAQRLAPLGRHLRGGAGVPAVTHLIVLPSGRMAGVPVEALTDEYTVSYAPSGTMFAWLREKKQEARARGGQDDPPALLAVGDPAFAPEEAPRAPAPEPPDHGVLLAGVEPGAAAARGGVRGGDVLLSYGGTRLWGPADLATALGRSAGGQAGGRADVRVRVWRDGRTLDLTVPPGPPGIRCQQRPGFARFLLPAGGVLASCQTGPVQALPWWYFHAGGLHLAAEQVRARQEGDAVLRAARGGAYAQLPATRGEVEALAKLFGRADKLLGAEASRRRLDELAETGRLGAFAFLHFATHGELNDKVAMHSALILAREHRSDPLLPVPAGGEDANGRVTAEQMLRSWKLRAELVTLSACHTAKGKDGGGEGYLGFAQALLIAGSRSLVLSLWEVDDTATALLMVRFYQNLLGRREGLSSPLPKAEALQEAKRWLRDLSGPEVSRMTSQLARGAVGLKKPLPRWTAGRPYEHPYYWAGFILIGDPGDVPAVGLAGAGSATPPPPTGWLPRVLITGGLLTGALLIGGGIVRMRRRHASRFRGQTSPDRSGGS